MPSWHRTRPMRLHSAERRDDKRLKQNPQSATSRKNLECRRVGKSVRDPESESTIGTPDWLFGERPVKNMADTTARNLIGDGQQLIYSNLTEDQAVSRGTQVEETGERMGEFCGESLGIAVEGARGTSPTFPFNLDSAVVTVVYIVAERITDIVSK
ncbi:uncharacterized protein BDV14DRAFT_139567 [Aspergillus stella-maris]|uniref:uncharacterized protein n=1 Tax=Aspergillus stella-maris TaxID=1810926 RepID=UPI003CCE33D4